MQIITTHQNADFDGLASMIAAQKLYPDAIMAFSGSQERSVRDFIAQNLIYEESFERAKDIRVQDITTLILVDTHSEERIGLFKDCLANPGLQLHIYDHHYVSGGNLHGNVEVIEDVGSTTTLLTRLIQAQDIEISPEEATLFALGIYEDTGSLTHLTTTPDDLRMAAWLLEKGAKLDHVAQYITHELTSVQIAILHELIKDAKEYVIHDIPVVVVTHSHEGYIDDFSLIVKRFMQMENLNVIFALASMAGRLYLICRSRISEVNVGAIARELGGNGHASAAAATLRDMTLIDAQEKLIHALHRHINPQSVAAEMMSKPAITIPPGATISDTKELLTRYNITAAPVRREPSREEPNPPILGIITRRIVEKAAHHNLGSRSTSEYMLSDVKSLPLNATLADIQELIIENRQRLIPIIQGEQLIGVVTRTDLLNRLVNDPAHTPRDLIDETEHPSLERSRNLSSMMVDFLGRKMIRLLQEIGMVARRLGFNSYAVGGFVRDLLLKKRNLDLDVVVEGDGMVFAKALSAHLNGRYRTHERFKTAVVTLQDGFKIDIATARLEYYEYPAAMPTVELSSIKLDLSRRDFTINAMAIHLNPDYFGTLIDFFNCQTDLKKKIVKVLHSLSFVEDPSRIFRAIRFEQRMGFTLSPHTKRLIDGAVEMKMFGKTDDIRFLSELKSILAEENPVPAMLRLADFNLYQFLWPNLQPHYKIDRRFVHLLHQSRLSISWFHLLYLEEQCQNWMVYLLAIMSRSEPEILASFCHRFDELPKTTDFLVEQKLLADKAVNQLRRSPQPSNSEIARILQDIKIEGLLYIMAIARKKHVKRAVSLYVTQLRQVRPTLTGKELKEMGYVPGPLFATILADLKNKKLDGAISSVGEEISFVEQHYPL